MYFQYLVNDWGLNDDSNNLKTKIDAWHQKIQLKGNMSLCELLSYVVSKNMPQTVNNWSFWSLYVTSNWSYFLFFFFFKQKTAYEILRSDWSSDVCSSDLFGSTKNVPSLNWPIWHIRPTSKIWVKILLLHPNYLS